MPPGNSLVERPGGVAVMWVGVVGLHNRRIHRVQPIEMTSCG